MRARTTRTVDRAAGSFTLAGRVLLVESAPSRRALNVTAYDFDGRQRYGLDLMGSTWMKKQSRLGYACSYDFLRSVVDLENGRIVRSGFPVGTRCATLLVADSRG